MDANSLTVKPKGGRPSVVEGGNSEPVWTRVDQATYHRIKAVAAHRGVPLAAVLRSILTTAFAYRREPDRAD